MNHTLFQRRFGALATIICGLGAILLFLVYAESNSASQENFWQSHSRQLAPPVPPSQPSWNGHMCSQIVTGTYRATWVINGASSNFIGEYHVANFDQSILEQSGTSLKVQVTSKAVLNTRATYPLDVAQLPADVSAFLLPTPTQQSNNPALLQQAQQLVQDAKTEVQASTGILDWVRANISYDYSLAKPTDAVSVFQNRSGVCEGFSNLAVALLRAVGIPSRKQVGCALWALPSGGGHAWIEIYYPDVGWVPSEPQGNQNFLGMNYLVSPRWYDWCGKPSTTFTATDITEGQALYTPRTVYSDTIWNSVLSAYIPAWDRFPLKANPSSVSFMLSVDNPNGVFSLQVENMDCWSEDWWINSGVSWLSPGLIAGSSSETAQFTVNATGMVTGFYTSPMKLYGWYTPTRIITANLWLVDRVYSSFLPFVARGNQ